MFKQPTQGGGQYIKLDQYEGNLVLYRPSSVDQVPAYKEPTKLVDEVTADWVAFGPDGEDVTLGAKFKGATLVRLAKEALRDVEHPFVLGVLVKVPTKETKDKIKIGKGKEARAMEYTPEDFAEARAAWLRAGAPSGQEPKHAWTMLPFDDDQAATAAAYVERTQRAADPFKAPTAE
jgi:hypothetical protein